MPRKSVLTPSQKVSLLSFPTSKIEFERYYTLSENDLFIIHQKREIHNRLGFALMLCCIRYPGISYDVDTVIEDNMMEFVKNNSLFKLKLICSYILKGRRQEENNE